MWALGIDTRQTFFGPPFRSCPSVGAFSVLVFTSLVYILILGFKLEPPLDIAPVGHWFPVEHFGYISWDSN